MKIEFDDGSYLELAETQDQKMLITMCGFKNKNQLTMSYSKLNKDNVADVIKFFSEWKDKLDIVK